MGCGCGGKKAKAKFSINPTIEGGWYIIELCGGYKLKYNSTIYLLVSDTETFTTSEQGVKEWALENCEITL